MFQLRWVGLVCCLRMSIIWKRRRLTTVVKVEENMQKHIQLKDETGRRGEKVPLAEKADDRKCLL